MAIVFLKVHDEAFHYGIVVPEKSTTCQEASSNKVSTLLQKLLEEKKPFHGLKVQKMTGGSETTRMLERRVSNNRADLNGDQQMNYFLSWFNTWSDLQKTDFVPILEKKVNSDPDQQPNMNGLSLKPQRPMSLFQCQLKLFKDWSGSWSPDQKEYLLMRLKNLDGNFYAQYEEYVQNGGEHKPKDYFEPGIPPELVKASRKDSASTSPGSSPNVSINDENGKNEEYRDDDNEDYEDREPLSTIHEDE